MADDADLAYQTTESLLQKRILAARGVLAQGRQAATECEECGAEIPEARRLALPGVTLCVDCAERREGRAHLWARC